VKFDTAFEILNQACNVYPNEYEILYRLVGLYLQYDEQKEIHQALINGFKLQF
jgi:hypothetical protein